MYKFVLVIMLFALLLRCSNSVTINHKDEVIAPNYQLNLSSQLNADEELIAYKLDTFFTHLNSSATFNGSILVARQGKIIFKKSFGVSNKNSNSLLNDSSMFQLASVSKVITATAVLMLHEKGLLTLNKPFKFYFPDFPYPNVTIKQLLNHRSGLPNYLYILDTLIRQPNYKMSNQDMYNHFVTKNPKPYLQPDTRFHYCNTNYALLAILIEKISKKSYAQFLHDELFLPLGMRNTATISDIDLNGKNVTTPYNFKWNQIAFDASDFVLGDKSIYSTPKDLFLFSEALYQNKIISAKTQQLAYTPYSLEKKLSNYGFGWRLKCVNDSLKKEVFHNGWWHGYRSSFHRRLNDHLTVIILSNQLNRSAYKTYKVYQIVDNRPVEDTLDYAE